MAMTFNRDGYYNGLSKDTKPAAAENGTKLLEIDTGDVYYFDADSGDRIKPGAEE